MKAAVVVTASSSPPPSAYGEIREVSPSDFSEAIDVAHPRTFVVAHIYQLGIEDCDRLNVYLELLARSLPRTQFVRLRSREAGVAIDVAGLPSLAIYRGGILEHNLTPVTESLPRPFGEEDVRALLEACGIADASFAATVGEATGAATATMPPPKLWTNEEDSDLDSDADLDAYCVGFDS